MALTTDTILAHARVCMEMADQATLISEWFDESARRCECCGTTRYNNFPQRNMRKRIEGVAERLHEIAATLARRADDPVFLTGVTTDDNEEG